MKKNILCTRFVLLFAAGLLIFSPASCVEYENPAIGTLTETYKYPKNLWGEWIRVDTGDTWYITSNYLNTRNNSSSYTGPKNGIVLARESDRVIKVTDPAPGTGLGTYYLYASRLPNGSFSGSVAGSAGAGSLSRSAMGALGGAGVTISRLNDKANEQQTETDEDGNFTADEIVPGDEYEVTVDGKATVVTPNTDGEDIGTVTVTGGANFKASIVPRPASYGSQAADLMRLFAGDTEYFFNIEAVNTGTEDFGVVIYTIEIPEGLTLVSRPTGSQMTGNVIIGEISTIRPGYSATLPISLKCPEGSLAEESGFFKINLELTDYSRGLSNPITWNDSVSLKFNRQAATFYIRSTAVLGSTDGSVSGVVIVPGAKAYHFRTSGFLSGSTATAVTVPRYARDDYYIIFSGANYTSEARYTFAVDQEPDTDFDSAVLTDLIKYLENNSEQNAAEIGYTDRIMGRLAEGKITYFKVDMRE